jgi:hypothetical protein
MTASDIQCRLEVYLELRRSLGFVVCYEAYALKELLRTYKQKVYRGPFDPKPSWTGLRPPIADLQDKEHA